MNPSQAILESWQCNAQSWIATINDGDIESRRLVTNAAIVAAVMAQAPKTVLDVGCGEGWLSRALRQLGVTVYGTDAIKELVEAAIAQDGPWYFQYSYRELVDNAHKLPAPFDAVVINFALIDKEDTEALVNHLPHLLSRTGKLIIQTLHPWIAAAGNSYKTGWRDGSWSGMKKTFTKSYQWWFRTLQDWVKLFTSAGFNLVELIEPLHPTTGQPASILFVLQLRS